MGTVRVHERRAFTLIELLVVIAIIAILIGLLLPAVQKVREAAAKTKCQNNLKQIAIALHMYHDSYSKFPRGDVAQPGVKTAGNFDWTWSALVLPYLEQSALYTQLNVEGTTLAPSYTGYTGTTPANPPDAARYALAQTSLSVFICPTDTGPLLNDKLRNYAKNNYPISNRIADVVGSSLSGGKQPSILMITDGTSNTFLVGERANPAGGKPFVHEAAIWACRIGTNPSYCFGPTSPMNIGLADGLLSGGQCCTSGEPAGQDTRGSVSSLHTGGAQFAFCDGSVKFIKQTIDASPGGLYQCLANIDDGKVLGDY